MSAAEIPSIRRALVSGGSRGIGLEIVRELQRRGISILAPTRDELDLASPASIGEFIKSLAGLEIDILVNNAAINHVQPLAQIGSSLWKETLQVNLTAPMQLIQAVAPGMRSRHWGRIVNLSSIFSLVTREGRAAYSTTKSGLNGLTRSCAIDLASSGILVNAVCPGYVETEMTQRNNKPAELDAIAATIPLGRLAQPIEIARLVGFLCSEENSYCTGQVLVADGGFTSI